MLKTDDELGSVNAEFLGPSGYTFPWRARYSAYGIASVLSLFAYYVIHRIGIPINVFTLAWATVVVVLLTRAIGQTVSYETPLRALFMILAHEITAPRPATTQTSVLRPALVKITLPKQPKVREPDEPVVVHTKVCLSDLCSLWFHDSCPYPNDCTCHCHQEN